MADLADDALKEWLQVLCECAGVVAGDTVGTAGVDDREVTLGIGGPQVDEKVEGGVNHKVGPANPTT